MEQNFIFSSSTGVDYHLTLVEGLAAGNSKVFVVTGNVSGFQASFTEQTPQFVLKYVSVCEREHETAKRRAAAIYGQLIKLDHKNVVKYLDYGENLAELSYRWIRLCCIQEYVQGGNLTTHCSNANLTEEDIRVYTLDIVEGIKYLHSVRPSVIHGDLKGDNILLTLDKKTAKICDLDSSKFMKATQTHDSDVPSKIGTMCFMSPEMLCAGTNGAEPVGRATDIWSLGCIVLQMYSKGEFFFTERFGEHRSVRNYEHEFKIMVVRGGRPDIPASASESLQLFVRLCLERTPSLRPLAADLLRNRFLDVSPNPATVSKKNSVGTAGFQFDARQNSHGILKAGDFEVSESIVVGDTAFKEKLHLAKELQVPSIERKVLQIKTSTTEQPLDHSQDIPVLSPVDKTSSIPSVTKDDNGSHNYELNLLNVLKAERQAIQEKTFTLWINSILSTTEIKCNDLFVDLADGVLLFKLLETISGENIGRLTRGQSRVHKVENLNKCLSFLHTKIRLESIGASDILDGNRNLILGLIWSIILRFQIQTFEADFPVPTAGQNVSVKERLLLWVQERTSGYTGVNVVNFTSSWKDGLAFSALIHSYRPDLIDYGRLNPDQSTKNLNHAFAVAEECLNVARLLDAKDMLDMPDEKSVMMYVSSFYHVLTKFNRKEND